jgi:hypothetical protein
MVVWYELRHPLNRHPRSHEDDEIFIKFEPELLSGEQQWE